jgi:hypothetical protein
MIGNMHFASAALCFLTLAYMSIFLFTKTHPENTRDKVTLLDHLSPLLVTRIIPGQQLATDKKRRNLIYRICGYTIVACMATILFLKVTHIIDRVDSAHPVFWLETGSVVAFGVSWLVKGELEQIIPRFRRKESPSDMSVSQSVGR